jgi:hypothetical protein
MFYFDEQPRRITQVYFGSLAGTTVGEVPMSETFYPTHRNAGRIEPILMYEERLELATDVDLSV